jgi:hypothetical protein
MHDPATIERAAFERRAGRVGPEMMVGTYIGPRIKGGRLQKKGRKAARACVVAMVRHKVTNHERICESCRLHELQDHIGAEIDVLPVGRVGSTGWDIDIPDGIILQEDPPILCGTTIGPRAGLAPTGTYGALVLGNDDKQYMLSNNHVLADVSGIVDGIHAVGIPVGSDIFHPGAADDSGSKVHVGRLAGPVPLLNLSMNQSSAPLANTVDCAKAEVDPAGSAQFLYHFLSGAIEQQPLSLSSVSPGLKVKKVGRTTGETFGRVIGVGGNSPVIGYNIGRNPGNGQLISAFGRFSDVLVIQSDDGSKFSNHGDSGSLILTDDDADRPQAVALLFGGTGPGQPELTFAIPIERIFKALDIARFINDL